MNDEFPAPQRFQGYTPATQILRDAGGDVGRPRLDDQSPTRKVRRLDVDEAEAQLATLLVISGHGRGEIHTLETSLTLGRGPACDIVIPDDGISREHCRFVRDVDGASVEDLGSTNGTWVNQGRITRLSKLASGSRVRLGARTVLRFALQSEADRAYYEDMRDAAVRDPLTGLFNKRHLHERLGVELAYSYRHKEPLALVVIDVDHFKAINDGHGHAAGDLVLTQLGRLLVAQTRAEDIVARFGGDELIIVARRTTLDGARDLAERLRAATGRTSFTHDGREILVTLSAGVAATDGTSCSADALFGAADAALYEAKARGRDAVVAVAC
ncbi:MAG: GGDEF domain-containing protein [Deltaproteobacteria bacterium]|nr:MAG: GGDEF domain-containing protein [Deltaproteobacteria bacterium]